MINNIINDHTVNQGTIRFYIHFEKYKMTLCVPDLKRQICLIKF
jgi:RNA polymerase-interacting CarD/CdnL/TRCF family regulator